MQHSESFIPLEHKELSKEQSEAATSDFYKLCDSRRSVRTFSEKEVPQHIIETIIKNCWHRTKWRAQTALAFLRRAKC